MYVLNAYLCFVRKKDRIILAIKNQFSPLLISLLLKIRDAEDVFSAMALLTFGLDNSLLWVVLCILEC